MLDRNLLIELQEYIDMNLNKSVYDFVNLQCILKKAYVKK